MRNVLRKSQTTLRRRRTIRCERVKDGRTRSMSGCEMQKESSNGTLFYKLSWNTPRRIRGKKAKATKATRHHAQSKPKHIRGNKHAEETSGKAYLSYNVIKINIQTLAYFTFYQYLCTRISENPMHSMRTALWLRRRSSEGCNIQTTLIKQNNYVFRSG